MMMECKNGDELKIYNFLYYNVLQFLCCDYIVMNFKCVLVGYFWIIFISFLDLNV